LPLNIRIKSAFYKAWATLSVVLILLHSALGKITASIRIFPDIFFDPMGDADRVCPADYSLTMHPGLPAGWINSGYWKARKRAP